MTPQELKELKEGDVIRVKCNNGRLQGSSVRAIFVGLKYPSWDKKNLYYHFENIDYGQGSIFTESEKGLLSPDFIKC